MNSSLPPPNDLSESTPPRFARLSQTSTFRNGGLERWRRALIAVIGAGVLGGPLTTSIVRSGAVAGVFDFDCGSVENQGAQSVKVGVHKAVTLVRACDEIAPGRAFAFACDVRGGGVGLLDKFDLLIDCSDDPNLALPLTEISNGLGKPLLRCALDGSGRMELGRVLCSNAATGHACQLCSYGVDDLGGNRRRTACPDQNPLPPAPTIAGGAMAMTIAGLGLLCAQRIITDNESNLVLGRETLVDLSNMQIVSNALPRSPKCLSGHLRWQLIRLGARARQTTLYDIFAAGSERLAATAITLEPYLSPLNLQASCDCGAVVAAIGTNWAPPPKCANCRQPMRWRREHQLARISAEAAAALDILDTPLTDLGMPEQGPLFVARTKGRPPVRFLLDCPRRLESISVSPSPQEVSP